MISPNLLNVNTFGKIYLIHMIWYPIRMLNEEVVRIVLKSLGKYTSILVVKNIKKKKMIMVISKVKIKSCVETSLLHLIAFHDQV